MFGIAANAILTVFKILVMAMFKAETAPWLSI